MFIFRNIEDMINFFYKDYDEETLQFIKLNFSNFVLRNKSTINYATGRETIFYSNHEKRPILEEAIPYLSKILNFPNRGFILEEATYSELKPIYLKSFYMKNRNEFDLDATKQDDLYIVLEQSKEINLKKSKNDLKLIEYYRSLKKIVYNYPIIAEEAISNGASTKGIKKLVEIMYQKEKPYEKFIKNIDQFLNTNLLPGFILYQVYMFNCMIRRNEGFFINQSLTQMKSTITQFLLLSMMKKFKTPSIQIPLIYHGHTTETCINNYLYQPFSFFNYANSVNDNTLISNNNEIIFKLLFSNSKINNVRCAGLKADNTKMMVFTLINCNDSNEESFDDEINDQNKPDSNFNIITNNPPNPPYINTNILKKFENESLYLKQINDYIESVTDKDTIEDIIDTYSIIKKKYKELYGTINLIFSERINLYDYYKSDINFQKLIESWLF